MTNEDGGTCQFCQKFNSSLSGPKVARLKYGGMVKYGVRHYAHFECFLAHKGLEGFKALPVWKAKHFPYFLLKEYGAPFLDYIKGK